MNLLLRNEKDMDTEFAHQAITSRPKEDTSIQASLPDNHDVLWLIDKDSLQSRILSALLADQLSLSTLVTESLPHEEILTNKSIQYIALINCQDLAKSEILQFLKELNQHKQQVRVALFNIQSQGPFGEFIEWPQVMGMFEADSDQKQLIKGLNEIIAGGHWLPRHLVSRILQTKRCAPIVNSVSHNLTKREQQILEHLVGGLTNAQISERIFVSEHTVRSHLYNIYKKIGAKNRIQACNWAEQNLIQPG